MVEEPDYRHMQAELRDDLIAHGPNLMITHNFGGIYKACTQMDRMKLFYCAIQAATFGRNWAGQFDRLWPKAYGFREHPNSNPHYHVLMKACPGLAAALTDDGPPLWLKQAPRGQLHVRPIRPGKLNPIIYCTKHLTHRQAWEDMFVYSDTR